MMKEGLAMKKFTKRALGIVLAVSMALTMSACGSKETAQDSGENGSAQTAFKVGGIGPLTGGTAVYGQAVKNAAELAVEEINAAGEVQIEFNYQDDEATRKRQSTRIIP